MRRIDTREHLSTAAPDTMAVFDADGDEYDTPTAHLGGSVRGFRGRPRTATAPIGDISLSDPSTARAQAHLLPGEPDERRQDTSANGHPSGDPATSGEAYSNRLETVTVSPTAPPERPRQGFTGADPARPALTRRPLFWRLFDKAIAEHPADPTRVVQPAPRAATPRALDDLANGFPSAGGSTGTGAEGIGPTRNTLRIMPRRWDSTLPTTPTTQAGPRRRFR